ncbi:threonine/serine exporter family protein, partial [Paenibacillus sonchi]
MILQLLTSFIAAATFCILFNAPVRALVQCGFAGMVGWMLYL